MKQIVIINCSRLHDEEAVQLAVYHVAAERLGASESFSDAVRAMMAAYGVTVTKSEPLVLGVMREVIYTVKDAEGGAGNG